MKIYEEKEIRDFNFWSGAADRVTDLTDDDWDVIEPELESMYPDGMSDTELNDFFWFEFDMIARMLGYDDEEDMTRKRERGYLDDDDLENFCEDWFKEFVENLKQEGRYDLIKQIATDLFLFDPYEDEEPTWEECYNHLMEQEGDYNIRLSIFEDDLGNYETDGAIPTWEDFREEMMRKQNTI